MTNLLKLLLDSKCSIEQVPVRCELGLMSMRSAELDFLLNECLGGRFDGAVYVKTVFPGCLFCFACHSLLQMFQTKVLSDFL